jgi:hypothetical protein
MIKMINYANKKLAKKNVYTVMIKAYHTNKQEFCTNYMSSYWHTELSLRAWSNAHW